VAEFNRQSTLYWHDYETWGEVPARDRPSQFAGIRTDEDLNIIGEPLMVYCRPAPDLLPKPEACLVTGLSPLVAEQQGLSERDFVALIAAELGRPGTCGVGYNSIRFDDEVTRYALYRNFYDPYEREWRNGNSRWDIIDMVRMTRALRPDGIVWPNYDDGTPCFKLEALTKANNLEHGHAHDALSDVYATIALARLIKQRQPKLYDYAWQLRDKRFVGGMLDIDACKPVLHISSRFPSTQGNAAIMLPLAIHPTNRNSIIAFNLASDPTDLLSLPPEVLVQRLYARQDDLPSGVERLALKEIHLNKTPMVLPVSLLDASTAERLGIPRERCQQHWNLFQQHSLEEREQLRSKLQAIYSASNFDEPTDPELMLYGGGFFGDADKQAMKAIRRADPAVLADTPFEFQDARLPELLFRYRARNFPQSLSADERRKWKVFCRERLTNPQAGASITWTDFQQRLADARTRPLDARAQQVLNELEQWAQRALNNVSD